MKGMVWRKANQIHKVASSPIGFVGFINLLFAELAPVRARSFQLGMLQVASSDAAWSLSSNFQELRVPNGGNLVMAASECLGADLHRHHVAELELAVDRYRDREAGRPR